MSRLDPNVGRFLKFRRQRQSILFGIAIFLVENNFPGGHRLVELLAALGVLDRDVRYCITPDVDILMPLYRVDNRYSHKQILRYEKSFIALLARLGGEWDGDIRLIDCGADIGTFSVLLYSQLRKIREIVLFEPNLHVWEILNANISRLPVQSTVLPYAVGEFSGRGRLVSPPYDKSDHARFIEHDPTGEICVMRVDDLKPGASPNVILKIDVEGAELAVLRGAAATLRAAENFVVGFEINKRVTARIGREAVLEFPRYLDTIRKCRYWISEAPDLPIHSHADLIDGIPASRNVVNIVCRPE